MKSIAYVIPSLEGPGHDLHPSAERTEAVPGPSVTAVTGRSAPGEHSWPIPYSACTTSPPPWTRRSPTSISAERLLGLRLVKRTVNFDNHSVYHFYYGTETGAPGTIWTTFPYHGWGVPVGVHGAGQIAATAFSVPAGRARRLA